jgi:hypothetical protein
MTPELGPAVLADSLEILRKYKELGEGAMRQIPPAALFQTLDGEANSIAVTVKHLAGNMRSRWTDFLTSDGEKPDRNRDSEFEVDPGTSAEDVRRWWDDGWRAVFAAIEPLRPEDLERAVTIRGQPHSVLQAINRQIAHYAYHVGQIVLLAKHFRRGEWETLSMPRKR